MKLVVSNTLQVSFRVRVGAPWIMCRPKAEQESERMDPSSEAHAAGRCMVYGRTGPRSCLVVLIWGGEVRSNHHEGEDCGG